MQEGRGLLVNLSYVIHLYTMMECDGMRMCTMQSIINMVSSTTIEISKQSKLTCSYSIYGAGNIFCHRVTSDL